MYVVFHSNFAAYIVYRRYKPCEFLEFVWTDCWGNKSNYVITSPANSHNSVNFVIGISSMRLRVRAFFHKTVRVCHVYCNFKIGFTCRITVIFGALKDGSLLINTLASNIFFSYRNIFQNGVDSLPKIVDAFLSKSSNFHLVRIIR